jgi:hypothetical protein
LGKFVADIQAVVWRPRKVPDAWTDVEQDAVAWVSVSALDAAWSGATDEYVGAGSVGSNQASKYRRFEEWFANARHVDRSLLFIDGDGRPIFTDGRPRFAWFRDQGLAALPIAVPPNEAGVFNARFKMNARVGTIIS